METHHTLPTPAGPITITPYLLMAKNHTRGEIRVVGDLKESWKDGTSVETREWSCERLALQLGQATVVNGSPGGRITKAVTHQNEQIVT
jgi:hypothetical protein